MGGGRRVPLDLKSFLRAFCECLFFSMNCVFLGEGVVDWGEGVILVLKGLSLTNSYLLVLEVSEMLQFTFL